MADSEGLLADLAGAILDGTPIDWPSAESSADESHRPVLDQLKLLAAVADLHRRLPVRASAGVEKAEGSRAEPETAGLAADDHVDTLERWGHLRVLERIGRGAFGEVYRAWDTRLDREVALKLLPAGSAAGDTGATSIIEEGRLLARVSHPNVVTIYGAERIEDRVGLWMEFVNGRTLQQILEQGKAFSAAEVVDIGIGLCQAISAVHGAGLLHRDIKAHNVMLAEDGRVVLMDFGTGRELSDDSASGLGGTPLYLAPELLSGAASTVRSDIYSAGVLLYHLLTGSYPVWARSLRDLRLAHERGERTDFRTARPDLSPKLAHIIDRAIDAQPERRHEHAAMLSDGLAGLKPRTRLVPLVSALGVAAAVILIVWIAAEIRGRLTTGAPLAAEATLTAGTEAGPAFSPAERPIIAVMPLKNLSAEPESDYFVDGLTDEIIRNLAVIQGLEVRSQTSSLAFKDKPRNLRDVGEQLGANLIVEGSVLREGRRLRINAQLVQVAGDVPLWSERFDRQLEDIFAIQDEISRAIVNKLRLTLGRGQRRYDTNLEAYDLYLKARAVVDRRATASAREAAKLFQQVIDRDPAFAPAYAGLVDAYAFMSRDIPGPRVEPISFESALSLMRPAAVRALELDPLLAEAHAAMGFLYSRERDWENAQRSFQRAIDLNPSLTHVYTNYSTSTLIPLGKLGEAERVVQAALRTDPLSLDVRREMAQLQIIGGRYNEAIDNLERVRAAEPDFPYADLALARALTFAGRLAEALPLWEKTKEDPGGQHWMAHAYILAGRRREVEKLAAAHDNPYRLAIFHAALGDKDRALEALDRAADSTPQRVASLLMYPEMAGLRSDARFAAVRRKLGLPP